MTEQPDSLKRFDRYRHDMAALKDGALVEIDPADAGSLTAFRDFADEATYREDQSSWPAHLRDDAPQARCSGCQRYTVAVSEFGQTCGMPQPNGSRCAGRFDDPRR